jgi:excisionase family DNA binding protein
MPASIATPNRTDATVAERLASNFADVDPTVKMLLVTEVAEILSIGKSSVYNIIYDGSLRAVHISQGRAKIRVPLSALREYVASLKQVTPDASAIVPTTPRKRGRPPKVRDAA